MHNTRARPGDYLPPPESPHSRLGPDYPRPHCNSLWPEANRGRQWTRMYVAHNVRLEYGAPKGTTKSSTAIKNIEVNFQIFIAV